MKPIIWEEVFISYLSHTCFLTSSIICLERNRYFNSELPNFKIINNNSTACVESLYFCMSAILFTLVFLSFDFNSGGYAVMVTGSGSKNVTDLFYFKIKDMHPWSF